MLLSALHVYAFVCVGIVLRMAPEYLHTLYNRSTTDSWMLLLICCCCLSFALFGMKRFVKMVFAIVCNMFIIDYLLDSLVVALIYILVWGHEVNSFLIWI
jgi:hypothetical protein